MVRTRALYHAHAVLGPNTGDALALESAGFTLALIERNYNIVLNAINRALKITPHSPTVFGMCSVVNSFAGHFETAIIQVENSLSLSPFDPMRFSGELAMAYSQYFLEHYDLTAEAAQRCVQINLRYLS